MILSWKISKQIYSVNNLNLKSGSPQSFPIHEIKFLSVFLCFLVLGFLAYVPVLSYPFVHDEVVFIQQNPHQAALTDWRQMLHWERPAYAVTNAYWRPALEFLYHIQYRLFGLNPSGYHLTNILLHIINSSLIFYCLNMIFRRPGMALAVAMIFLLHPVQSEAVACISGISNLLFVLFGLLSFLFYRRSLGLSLGFYALALMSKEQAVVFPLLILLYELCMKDDRREPGKGKCFLLSGLAGFIGISGLYLLLRKIFLGSALVSLWSYPQELVLRLLAIPRALLMYAQILLWPEGLHYYRSLDILAPWQAAAAVLVLVILGIVLWLRCFPSLRRPFLFGLGWFTVALLPTLNILPLIHEYSFIAAFEHFLYLPLAGFFLCLFLAGEQIVINIFKSRSRTVCLIILTLVSTLCLWLTGIQIKYWRGEIPLFERALQYEQGLGRVHFLLGQAYYFHKDYDRAVVEFTAARRIMETYLEKAGDAEAKLFYEGFLRDIYFDLAHCYEAQGRWPQAIEAYGRILKLVPDSAEIYNSIGHVYATTGDWAMAKGYFVKAVELDPRHLMALSNLAVCYIYEKDFQRAEDLLSRVLAIDSQFAPARRNLEQLLLQKKQDDI